MILNLNQQISKIHEQISNTDTIHDKQLDSEIYKEYLRILILNLCLNNKIQIIEEEDEYTSFILGEANSLTLYHNYFNIVVSQQENTIFNAPLNHTTIVQALICWFLNE